MFLTGSGFLVKISLMKNLIAGVLLIIIGLQISVSAKPIRINFKRGATRTVVSHRLNGYRDKVEYVIRLREGQTLTLEGNGKNHGRRYVTLGIVSPSGGDATDSDASCNGNKRIAPTEAGDYKITVVECRKADPWRGNFFMTITAR